MIRVILKGPSKLKPYRTLKIAMKTLNIKHHKEEKNNILGGFKVNVIMFGFFQYSSIELRVIMSHDSRIHPWKPYWQEKSCKQATVIIQLFNSFAASQKWLTRVVPHTDIT